MQKIYSEGEIGGGNWNTLYADDVYSFGFQHIGGDTTLITRPSWMRNDTLIGCAADSIPAPGYMGDEEYFYMHVRFTWIRGRRPSYSTLPQVIYPEDSSRLYIPPVNYWQGGASNLHLCIVSQAYDSVGLRMGGPGGNPFFLGCFSLHFGSPADTFTSNNVIYNINLDSLSPSYRVRQAVHYRLDLLYESIDYGSTMTPLDIDINQNDIKKSLSVYPNPSSGWITVQTPKSAEVTVSDLIGREIMILPTNKKSVLNLSPGQYILATKNGGYTIQIIK